MSEPAKVYIIKYPNYPRVKLCTSLISNLSTDGGRFSICDSRQCVCHQADVVCLSRCTKGLDSRDYKIKFVGFILFRLLCLQLLPACLPRAVWCTSAEGAMRSCDAALWASRGRKCSGCSTTSQSPAGRPTR